jgi:hypothetical protein
LLQNFADSRKQNNLSLYVLFFSRLPTKSGGKIHWGEEKNTARAIASEDRRAICDFLPVIDAVMQVFMLSKLNKD